MPVQRVDPPGLGRFGRSMRCMVLFLSVIVASLFGAATNADDLDTLRTKAGQGQAGALFDLAERHERGDGIVQDLGLAAALYEQAAKRGHPLAQYRFGLARSMGLGVAADPIDAHGWLTLATTSEGAASDLAAILLEAWGDEVDQAGRDQAATFAETFEPIAGPLDQASLPLLDPAPLDDPPALPDDLLTAGAEPSAAQTDQLCAKHEQMATEAPPHLVGFVPVIEAATDNGAGGTVTDIDLVQVAPVICDILRLLDSSTLIDPAIGLVLRDQDNVIPETFSDGDILMIDAAAGDESRQVFIDYVVHDGTVVHLFPNAATPDNRMPASTRMQIGGPDTGANEWRVAPPFGNDLVIFYSSGEPLHEAVRDDVETAETYLPYLRERLAELAARTEIGIDYHVVQTAAR